MCNPTMKNARILNGTSGPRQSGKRERGIERVRENSKSDTSKIVRQIKAVNHSISPFLNPSK